MKLAVSNIAWEHSEFADHLRLIRDLGCQGVELAPSCIWPEPVDASSAQREAVRSLITSVGLEVAGFHALLYTRPDLQLFESRIGLRQTMNYLKHLLRLCSDLGGKILVFGSPKNRIRAGREYTECLAWAAEGFGDVAREAQRLGVSVCIEPLAPSETDFIQSSDDGMRLVSMVNHPHFSLHLDAKAMIVANEDPSTVFAKYGRHVRHFHVGDPGLAPPGSTGADHSELGRALRGADYHGYVSIEMRKGFGPTRETVTRSVNYVKKVYLGLS